jgi:hypothetical protein
MDPTFREAATKLAEKYLIAEKTYVNFLIKVDLKYCQAQLQLAISLEIELS